MDEILIEEKRYVSSKQAAKLTGYAKDYVGQLCREGRVPARLVGRSWYVLESAIQDHRFGAAAVEPKEKVKEENIKTPLTASLETPRYEAAPHEELPSIEDLVAGKTTQEDHTELGADLQESWGAWFAQTGAPTPLEEDQESAAAIPEVTEESIMPEDTEVNVPIRAIHHSFYQPTTDEMLPHIVKEEPQMATQEEVMLIKEPYRPSDKLLSSIRLGGILVGAIAVIVAVLGSGYFDNYVLSNKGVSPLAGVSFYNR